MEEWVGKQWHHFISRVVAQNYPQASVNLHTLNKSLGIVFRALGGEGGLKLAPATPSTQKIHLGWLARLAGADRQFPLASRDAETLRLPMQISRYPTPKLNQDAYYWLVALASEAATVDTTNNWLSDNQRHTCRVLSRYPGMYARYQHLVEAELARRPNPAKLPYADAQQERLIQHALHHPEQTLDWQAGKNAPFPVWLWLYPAPAPSTSNPQHPQPDTPNTPGSSQQAEQKRRYRAEQTDMPQGKDGLITMRWENILTWSEYIKVNRATEEDEPNADAADDLNVLHVARNNQSTRTRLRLDLDLPAAAYDDIPLQGETLLPEWHWRKQQLIADHCCIRPMLPRNSQPQALPEHLQRTARILRKQFSTFAQQRIWLRAQTEGSELDMSAYLDNYTARRCGYGEAESHVYRNLLRKQRDLSTLLLADLSLSTDAAINNTQRVIDVVRDSLLLFAEALEASGDRYALYGFSSRKREEVRFFHLKPFEQPYNDTVRGHIQAIRPGYYTRMGAAIRQASQLLSKQKTSQKLLLLLTDGKPNDMDYYEGRYGVEDTRHALQEAKKLGLLPFCLTIDHKACDYLPHLFGKDGYALLQNPEKLPQSLLNLYVKLTRD